MKTVVASHYAERPNFPMFYDITKSRGAVISDCGYYRYLLWRAWRPNAKWLIVIMLNPSTADENANDATIRKVCRKARDENYGAVLVMNMFALRSRDPLALKRSPDPIGDNFRFLCDTPILDTDLVMVGWGAHAEGLYQPYWRNVYYGTARFQQVDAAHNIIDLLQHFGHKPVCMGKTKYGQPRHPLLVRDSTPFEDFELRSAG